MRRSRFPCIMIVTDLFGTMPSRSQEFWNTLTHGLGLLFSIPAAVFLMVKSCQSDNWINVVSSGIFSFALTSLYTSSTLYHKVSTIRLKFYLRKVDHSAIYIFIAASYTPFSMILMQDHPYWGWPLCLFIWIAAISGILYKSFFIHKYDTVATLLYIAMGWVAIAATTEIIERLPITGILLLISGGLSYTLGTAFYFWRSLKLHHAIWHLFVLIGSLFHYLTIHQYIV